MDAFLYRLNEHGLLCAVVVLSVPAETAEVGIHGSVSTAAVADDHSEAAMAVDAAFQVVRMLPCLLARAVFGAEDVLDFLPGRFVNEGIVTSGILNALVAHNTLVERVTEYQWDV